MKLIHVYFRDGRYEFAFNRDRIWDEQYDHVEHERRLKFSIPHEGEKDCHIHGMELQCLIDAPHSIESQTFLKNLHGS